MKRTRSGAIYGLSCVPTKRTKLSPELPVEIWHMIFSQISFDDMLTCRTICRNWCDLIATLPAFKDKSCLVLGYCSVLVNEPPLPNEKFPVGSLKFAKCSDVSLDIQLLPTFPTFLIRISESLTHLNISNIRNHSDPFRIFLENLSIFKVLKKLKVGSLINWLEAVGFRLPDRELFKDLLLEIYEDCNGHLTYEFARNFLNSSAIYLYPEVDHIKKYRQLLLQKIKNNLDLINKNKARGVELIFKQVCLAIMEPTDLSSKINTSIKIISIKDIRRILAKDVENLMVLVPNLQEINAKSCDRNNAMELLEKLPEKITKFRIGSNDIDWIQTQTLNLCNLKHVQPIGDSETVKRCIGLFPTLKSISNYDIMLTYMPESHFRYLTNLFVKVGYVVKERLTLLNAFQKLRDLKVFLTQSNKDHFFSHDPFNLASIKKLLVIVHSSDFCLDCMKSLIKSMTNLRELEVENEKWAGTDSDWLLTLDMVFKYQTNLESLKITSLHTSFKPNDHWSEMKSLRHLEIYYRAVGGSEAAWNRFGKKLKKLKYFRVSTTANQCVNSEQMIGSNMPALQRVKVSSRSYEYPRPTAASKVIVRESNNYELVLE